MTNKSMEPIELAKSIYEQDQQSFRHQDLLRWKRVNLVVLIEGFLLTSMVFSSNVAENGISFIKICILILFSIFVFFQMVLYKIDKAYADGHMKRIRFFEKKLAVETGLEGLKYSPSKDKLFWAFDLGTHPKVANIITNIVNGVIIVLNLIILIYYLF